MLVWRLLSLPLVSTIVYCSFVSCTATIKRLGGYTRYGLDWRQDSWFRAKWDAPNCLYWNNAHNIFMIIGQPSPRLACYYLSAVAIFLPNDSPHRYDLRYHKLIQEQNDIGWRHMFNGRLEIKWSELYRRKNTLWSMAVIQEVHMESMATRMDPAQRGYPWIGREKSKRRSSRKSRNHAPWIILPARLHDTKRSRPYPFRLRRPPPSKINQLHHELD